MVNAGLIFNLFCSLSLSLEICFFFQAYINGAKDKYPTVMVAQKWRANVNVSGDHGFDPHISNFIFADDPSMTIVKSD